MRVKNKFASKGILLLLLLLISALQVWAEEVPPEGLEQEETASEASEGEDGGSAKRAEAEGEEGSDGDEAEKKSTAKVITGQKRESLTLSIGVSKTLEFPFEIGPVHLGEGELFIFRRIRAGGKERKLLLVPKSAGYTDMTVHDTMMVPRVTYSVRVTREDMGQIISQLEDLLGDIEGIRIKPVGGTIVIDGDILLPKDMVRIIRVVDALKDRDTKKKSTPIRNLANISQMTMNIIAERIEREIGSPDIQVRVLNNNILIEGTAQNNFEAERAIEMARTYLPETVVEKNKGDGVEVKPKAAGGQVGGIPVIIDLLRLAPPPASAPSKDIKITMNYVELTNEYNKTFSFNWAPLVNDQSNISFSSSLGSLTSNLVATVTSLFPKLVQAKSHGHARILKQEQIIVKDRADKPAMIDSSVQFFITAPGSVQAPGSAQPVTVQNTTKVRAASIPGSDSIELGIQVTLNSLIGSQGGNPIIAKNSLQTQVIIKNGDSAALGGYAIDEALSGYNRDPTRSVSGTQEPPGQGTAIFDLTRSKKYNRNKQQYVIFVTPEIIRTASAATEDITRKFRLNAGER